MGTISRSLIVTITIDLCTKKRRALNASIFPRIFSRVSSLINKFVKRSRLPLNYHYSRLTTIVGHIELNGRLPGRIKFAGDGGSSKALVILGELKSSISSLNIIPVDSERIIAPSLLNKDAYKLIKYYALFRIILDFLLFLILS